MAIATDPSIVERLSRPLKKIKVSQNSEKQRRRTTISSNECSLRCTNHVWDFLDKKAV